MIISRIRGGLGNQLFQYAAGKALSIRTGRSLRLDTSWFDQVPQSSTRRRLYIFEFDINATAAEPRDVKLATESTLVRRMLRKVLPKTTSKIAYIIDDASKFFTVGGDIDYRFLYLDGYWQSEEYFQSVADVIHRELQIKNRIENAGFAILEETSLLNSVCVHVRRGDYISNPRYADYYATCSIDYYERAMNLIRTRLAGPTFFVFSDEPEWVWRNFPRDNTVRIVDSQSFTDGALTDFALMRNCRHFIIANSTFSWWAAWLGAFTEKFVLAPATWFINNPNPERCIIPGNWLRIANEKK